MYATLAAAKAPEPFNADYYLAIVTILPIFMVAINILANFAKSVPREVQDNWPSPFYRLVSILYLYCPVIAAIGVVMGILALMNRDNSFFYHWVSFVCLIIVLAFLAIASVIYLAVSDPAKDAQAQKRQERNQRKQERKQRKQERKQRKQERKRRVPGADPALCQNSAHGVAVLRRQVARPRPD